jgi:pimeloyl-ACP methyl ester carboxylesterase
MFSKQSILPKRRVALAVGLAGLLAALWQFAVIGSGASAAARASRAPKSTIVLVHGAFADASSWTRVIARLQRDGYKVIAPANPLRSLSGDSSYIAGVLAQTPGPIVLVGHSYGGAVITNAAAGNRNVKALVYVDAFIPDVGESILHLAGTGSELGGALQFQKYPPFGPTDIEALINPERFNAVFAADLPARTADAMAASQRPLALAAGEQPSQAAAWKTIKSWDVIGLADKAITPQQQLFMAHRAHARITEIPGASHVSMISHPDAVTRVIERAATTVG